MLVYSLEIILRIVTKVKNILLASLPPILVLLVYITLRRILVEVLILLGIEVPIILLIITLR